MLKWYRAWRFHASGIRLDSTEVCKLSSRIRNYARRKYQTRGATSSEQNRAKDKSQAEGIEKGEIQTTSQV